RLGSPASRSAAKRRAGAAAGAGARGAHERRLAGLAPFAFLRTEHHPTALGAELPHRGVVLEQDVERTRDLLLCARLLDRRHELDTVVEVAWHEVGASHQVSRRTAGVEDEQAAVLEEAAEDAANADR